MDHFVFSIDYIVLPGSMRESHISFKSHAFKTAGSLHNACLSIKMNKLMVSVRISRRMHLSQLIILILSYELFLLARCLASCLLVPAHWTMHCVLQEHPQVLFVPWHHISMSCLRILPSIDIDVDVTFYKYQ